MTDSDPIAAIEGLRSAVDRSRTETTTSIDRLRTDLTGRMDQMVTRREHEAEVRRIDSEHKSLATALAVHADASEATNVDIDRRLVAIEEQVWKWIGGTAVASIVVSAAIAFIASMIQKG